MTRTNRAAIAAAGLYTITASRAALAVEPEPGLPQLDITTWPSQLLWLALVFGCGYLFMWLVVTPKIGSVLEARQARIKRDLADAKRATKKAQNVRESYEAGLEKARDEAAKYARNATAAAAKATAEAEAQSAEKTAKMMGAAEVELAKARTQAENNITAVAAEIAIDVAARLAGVNVTPQQAGTAVRDCAKALKKEAG